MNVHHQVMLCIPECIVGHIAIVHCAAEHHALDDTVRVLSPDCTNDGLHHVLEAVVWNTLVDCLEPHEWIASECTCHGSIPCGEAIKLSTGWCVEACRVLFDRAHDALVSQPLHLLSDCVRCHVHIVTWNANDLGLRER